MNHSTRQNKPAHERVENETPVVSDHAVLRYLERVEGMDIESLRNKILTEELAGRIEMFPNGVFRIGQGYEAVVRNRTVVTVQRRRKYQRTPKSREELIAQRDALVENE